MESNRSPASREPDAVLEVGCSSRSSTTFATPATSSIPSTCQVCGFNLQELEEVAAINDNGIAIAFDTGKGRVVHDGHVLPCLMEAYGPAKWRDAGAVRREYLSKAFHQPGTVLTNKT